MTSEKNTIPATLATVKHGGCVQLGDWLPPLPHTDYNAYNDGSEPLYTAQQMQDYARAALADALPDIESWSKGYSSGYARAVSDLAARQPVGEPVAEAWIVVKEHAWDHGDGGRPTLAYLWPSEFERRVYPSFAAASEFIKAGDWPLGFVAMQIEAPTAQAVDLGQLPHGIRFIEIPRRNNLDPINVFVQDYDPGRGRIVVTCYGQAWCGFWGAMGDRTVMQFVAACDAKYVASNMLSGGHGYIKKPERAYVERIATEVITEFRALIDSQAVGNG